MIKREKVLMDFISGQEAEALEQAWDNAVSRTYQELMSRSDSPVREDVLFDDSVPRGSAERVAARLWVSKMMENDSSIRIYEEPSEGEMIALLAWAKLYDGSWYHSRVHVTKPEGGNWSKIQDELISLPESSGVYLTLSFNDAADLFSAFE
jgi:hypothetical protein